MPQLCQSANLTSMKAQDDFVGGTRLRLGLLVLAAVLGLTAYRVGKSDIDALAIASTLLFVGALMVEGYLWRNRPDKAWYDARAVAESAKTLTWKFAVRGEPFFDQHIPEEQMVRRVIDKLEEVRAQFKDLDLVTVDALYLSKWMREQRAESWTDRRAIYLQERLQDQKTWYQNKAMYNRKRSRQWRFALVVLEFVGVSASLLAAFSEDVPAVAPAVATMVVAAVAWLGVKQHDFNARAYSAAVTDLARAEAELEITATEADWAIEVANAEEAISREHTLWLASRTEL